jgi:hypothetical protein
VADPGLAKSGLAAGDYAYQAKYVAGTDTNHSDSDWSSCENFTVNKSTPSVTTELHKGANDTGGKQVLAVGGSVPLGQTMHDSATVTNGGFAFTGTMTFEFFANKTCADSTAIDSASGVAISSGVADPALVESNLGAGTYAYHAKYVAGSDPNHNDSDWSACEWFTVDKSTPSVTTELHKGANDTGGKQVLAVGGSVPLGQTMHDSATVTNGGFAFSGTMTFEFFKNQTCADTTAVDSTTGVAISSGVADPALVESNLGAGTYAYHAKYVAGSDPNHNDSSWSSCEWFTVNTAQPTIHTTLHNATGGAVITNGSSLPTFSSVYDTSALSGQVGSFSFNGTATVTYRFFKNGACSGTPFDTDVKTVASDGTVPQSKTEGPLQAGSYAFQAYYSGNGNYKNATSECEPFNIVLTALTPGYWKNHMANSNSKGPFYSTDCKTVQKSGGSCSSNGPWTIQYLPQSLGNFQVTNITTASLVFQAMNCSSTKDQDAIGCLTGHLLAAKLNLANGSAPLACILQAVADADAFLKGQTVNGVPGITYIGPSGKYTLTAAQRTFVVNLKTVFDKYNNGIAC